MWTAKYGYLFCLSLRWLWIGIFALASEVRLSASKFFQRACDKTFLMTQSTYPSMIISRTMCEGISTWLLRHYDQYPSQEFNLNNNFFQRGWSQQPCKMHNGPIKRNVALHPSVYTEIYSRPWPESNIQKQWHDKSWEHVALIINTMRACSRSKPYEKNL